MPIRACEPPPLVARRVEVGAAEPVHAARRHRQLLAGGADSVARHRFVRWRAIRCRRGTFARCRPPRRCRATTSDLTVASARAAVLTFRDTPLTLGTAQRGTRSVLSRPRISLTAAIGLIDAIKVRNADPDEVLRSVGLDRRAVSDPQRSIASRDFTRLLNAAARATANDCFGLRFGEQFQPKDI